MYKIDISDNKCKKDGLCVMVCPMNIFVQKEKKLHPVMVHEELCITCGHCLAVCPSGAITHSGLIPNRIHPIIHENLPSPEMLVTLINARRSIRAFKNVTVRKEVIEQIINAACAAPSAHNTQSTEFIVVQDQEALKKIVELTIDYLKRLSLLFGNPILQPAFSLLFKNKIENINTFAKEFKAVIEANIEGKDMILHNAQTLIIFHARQNAVFAEANANLAVQNASLLAYSLKLGAFYTGYIINACENDNRIAKFLGIPKSHHIYAGLAIGVPSVRFTHWIEKENPKIRWQ